MSIFRALSASAALVVATAAFAQPANDNCANAITVANNSVTPFSNVGATTDGPLATCGAGANNIWYVFTAGNTGQLTVSCCDATYDSCIQINTGCAGTSLACNDDFCGNGLQSTVTANLTAGQTVYISLCGYNGATGSGNLTVSLGGPPPPADDLPATANVPVGSGPLASVSGHLGAGDAADMYKITICDFANFTASTVGTAAGNDTELFLFDSAGNGVQMDDDTPAGGSLQSSMGAEFVTANGTYYIAISHYDNDVLNAAGLEIWADTPFAVVRAPDGLNGGDIQPASWQSLNTTSFDYTINMTGACYPGCAADFNGDGVVDFFDYLDFVDAFSQNNSSADFNNDDVIDFFDYLDFVDAFSHGC